jgi:hypothetical protein
VLLVEQDVSQALRVASHLQCLLEGHTTLEGRPSDVTPEQVEAAYFGLAPAGHGGAATPSPGGDGGPGRPSPGGTGSPSPGAYGGTGSPSPGAYGGTGSPSPGGYGGAGSPSQGGSGGMGPPGRKSRGGLGGIVPPEEAGSPLWRGSTTSSRGS